VFISKCCPPRIAHIRALYIGFFKSRILYGRLSVICYMASAPGPSLAPAPHIHSLCFSTPSPLLLYQHLTLGPPPARLISHTASAHRGITQSLILLFSLHISDSAHTWPPPAHMDIPPCPCSSGLDPSKPAYLGHPSRLPLPFLGCKSGGGVCRAAALRMWPHSLVGAALLVWCARGTGSCKEDGRRLCNHFLIKDSFTC